ncbi:MAG: streptomycin biosynthesis protein StrG [Clostridiales bacterium]|nr:streptomycin biosynthesis protein StrG [Clostridiales bacterium]
MNNTKQLNICVLDYLSDEQVKELLKAGFSFSHKSLEEYVSDSGKELKAGAEFDWGESVGNEIW